MTRADWPQVHRIWAEGIAGGDATFELAPPSWAGFDTGRVPALRLVATADDGQLLGWVAAGRVSARPAYRGVVEHSVYVAPEAHGAGVGTALLRALIAASEAIGVWTIHTGVFPENEASLRLHSRCGFRVIGVQHRVGPQHGRWRDVVRLERRSTSVGGDGPMVRLAEGGAEPQQVRALVEASRLPTAGLDDAWRCWIAVLDPIGGPTVAAAALERYGDTFLLRSVVVDAAHRGTGLGARLVRAALAGADLEVGGRAPVGLLTETADGWFDRFGFAPVDRAQLPAELSASAELAGACPASARAYLRRSTPSTS
jgi:phosphinothricin acetyltransferase